jgi:hypothetical protein
MDRRQGRKLWLLVLTTANGHGAAALRNNDGLWLLVFTTPPARRGRSALRSGPSV